MTLYFWDASDFDWDRGPMNLAKAKAAGISGFTHKATEGTTTKHAHLKAGLERARDAGVPFIGAYMVPRTPGNGGNGSIAAQVEFFLDYLHSQVPWLFGYAGGFAQMDTEIWSSGSKVYDHVSAANGHSASVLVASKAGLKVIHYAPHWAYPDVPGSEPLWSSDYEGGKGTSFEARYLQMGGKSGSGWKSYGSPKRKPVLWQFAGGAVTIGSQPDCDASAFEGSVADFYRLIGKPAPTSTTSIAGGDDMQLSDKMPNFPWAPNPHQDQTFQNAILVIGNQTHAGYVAALGNRDPQALAQAVAPFLAAALAPLMTSGTPDADALEAAMAGALVKLGTAASDASAATP